MRALDISATGIAAQQSNIDRVANDFANVNTDGYKKGRVEFQDLMYETVKKAGGQLGEETQSPVGIQYGHGVKVGANHKEFSQGPSRVTNGMLDFMIEGRGFFPVQMPNGEIAYTRNGSFRRDAQGRVLHSTGASLIPAITLPSNMLGMRVTNSGEIIAQMPGGTEATIGQLQLVNFQNEDGLEARGSNMFFATLASGAPVQGIPNEANFGNIQPGHLEGSNVDISSAMVDMIQTQRAYEMNTKVMSVADEMMKAMVNIK